MSPNIFSGVLGVKIMGWFVIIYSAMLQRWWMCSGLKYISIAYAFINFLGCNN